MKACAKGILRTKIHRPPVTTEHVYREHLIECLNKNKYKPFTLISTPAGYGKSMLASSWLEKCKCANVWISLSAEENDLHSFLSYILFALTQRFPGTLSEYSALHNAPESPPFKIISETLLNEWDEFSELDHIEKE